MLDPDLPVGAVLGREGEGLGEGEEEAWLGGYSGDTDTEAGQGNPRLGPHFTFPCTGMLES